MFTSDTETNPSRRAESDPLMARRRTRRSRGITDNELLASGWGELKGTAMVKTRRIPFPTCTAPFSTRHRTLCERRGRWFEGATYSFAQTSRARCIAGASPTDYPAAVAKPIVRGERPEPPVCLECHLMLAEGCWS